MKLIIEKEKLVNNLENVSKALSTRNIIPILNGIKFKVNSEGLYLTASDNEISIEILIKKENIKEIEENGELVIAGGSKLLEILKRLNNVDILIESNEDNEIVFKTQSFEYKSNCFPIEDYPNIKFEYSNKQIKIKANEFKEMINKTVFACSLQESRPIFTGINIIYNNNILEFNATDTYRLSKVQTHINEDLKNEFNIIVPSKNINELFKILNKDSNININIFENKVLFEYENIKFQSSLINSGTFPNTNNSIPNDFEIIIKANIKELLSVVDRASLISQSKDKNIIEMEIINNNLTIRASSLEIGKIEETIIIDNLTNNNIKITFSSKYMLDALKVFDNENVILLLNSEIKPIIIREENNENVTELILPFKLN